MLAVLCGTALYLFYLHVLEAILWAAAFLVLPIEELSTFEEATYFSIVTFTTLGLGDVAIHKPWRLLTGLEAMKGLLIFGWSTAIFFAIMERVWKMRESAGFE